MKLSLVVVVVLTQIVAGVFAQEVEQGQRELFLFGWFWNLFKPKPTPSPTLRPTLKPPTLPPTLTPTQKPTLTPTQKPTLNLTPTLPTTKLPTSPLSPLAVHLKLVVARIRETMALDPRIGATYLRLVFHDCVPNGAAGGCDGCINLEHGANFGLEPALDALAPITRDLEKASLQVSRADIWMLAGLLAAEDAQSGVSFTDTFRVGRKNCETVGTCKNTVSRTCAINGPDQPADYPSPHFTTHELIDFMKDHFGYSADDTVAIMGAHTIGRALPDNAGFDGKWVTNEFALDNEYYKELVGDPVLADAPDRTQMTVASSGAVQWTKGAGSPLLMLTVDIALARDLGNDGLDATCAFRFPVANRCPLAETLTKAGVYRKNNDEWVKDFKRVLIVMVEKGLA